MGLSGCYGVIKYLVVLVNLIFWLVGLAVLILAVWMLSDPTFYLSMTQDESNYYIGIYIFLAAGALMLVVAFLGCCGAFRENQCMLVSFFCCLLVILVAEIAAGAWAYYNSDRLEGMVRASVKSTVQEEYGIIQSRTVTFDAIQKGLKCCGASGPQDWARSRFNGADANSLSLAITSILPIYNIPKSCCKSDISETICEQSRKAGVTAYLNPAINSSGCIDKLIETIREHMSWVIGVAIGIGVLELFGLIFSVVLCIAIKRNDRYKA